MANLRAVLLFCCLLLLTGCHPPDIEVAVRDCSAHNLTLQLTQGRNFYTGLPNPASVYFVGFYDEDTKPLSELWSIESLRATGEKLPPEKDLSTFTYGVAPAGFQGSQAKPLQPGRLVHVRIDGIAHRELDLTVCQ